MSNASTTANTDEEVAFTSESDTLPLFTAEHDILIHGDGDMEAGTALTTGIWRWLKWVVLLLSCLLLLGNYYNYDLPGALNDQLQKYLDLPYDSWQFQMNALYTSYSLPNLIMPIVGGVLIDSMGATRTLLAFSIVMILGQVIFALGVSYKIFPIMALGRVIFGIGGESLEVAQARITTEWFRDGYLGLALGLNLTSARLATASNDFISPLIAGLTNPPTAVWFGVIICLISMFCGLLLTFLNKKHEARVASTEEQPLLTDEQKVFIEDNDQVSVVTDSDLAVAEAASDHGLHFGQVRRLPSAFWILCLCIVLLYGAVNPFIHILSDMLQKKWFHDDPVKAGQMMAIPDLISAIGSPLFGYWLDHLSASSHSHIMKRVRSCFLPLSAILLFIVHYRMGFSNEDPTLSLVLLGFSYSVFGACLWPLVPHFVTNRNMLGTAYGMGTVAMNLSLTLGPLIVASVHNYGGYELVETYFMIVSALSAACGFVLFAVDVRT